MELIPGLPNDVARDCLIRVMYKQFATVFSVCKAWQNEVELPEYWQRRKETCNTQKVVVMAQARVNPGKSSTTLKYRVPIYRFTLLELDTGNWCELPPIPEFSNGIPIFCQVVGVGSDLVVLGGLDPVSWEVSSLVFIFDFVSATWRRGADMPGVRRSLFGCASDFDRLVYVVGGHDDEKNALRSAMRYDVEKNEWVLLPDMVKERDECKAIFHRGKLHVIGGYCTDMQGRFEKTAEVLDVAMWHWDGVEECLEAAASPKTCVYGEDDGKLYMHRGGDDVTSKDHSMWQVVAKLPADVSNASHLTAWQDKLFVMGSAGFGEPHKAYVLDLRTYKWTTLETPEQYSGHVQSGCYLEI